MKTFSFLTNRTYAKPPQRRCADLPYNSYCLRRRALLGQFCVSPVINCFSPKTLRRAEQEQIQRERNAVPLEDVMKKELQFRKHSLENPAFVERPKLKKILMEF